MGTIRPEDSRAEQWIEQKQFYSHLGMVCGKSPWLGEWEKTLNNPPCPITTPSRHYLCIIYFSSTPYRSKSDIKQHFYLIKTSSYIVHMSFQNQIASNFVSTVTKTLLSSIAWNPNKHPLNIILGPYVRIVTRLTRSARLTHPPWSTKHIKIKTI